MISTMTVEVFEGFIQVILPIVRTRNDKRVTAFTRQSVVYGMIDAGK